MSTTGTMPLRPWRRVGNGIEKGQCRLSGSSVSEDVIDIWLPEETDDAIGAVSVVTVGEYAPLKT